MHRRSKLFLFAAVCLPALILTSCGTKNPSASSSPSPAGTAKTWSQQPAMKIDPKKIYLAEFKTSKGNFTVELFAKDAPKTVNNFVFLAKEGYYNAIPIFRIIQNYMFQTGDPSGTGKGSPGYKFEDEHNNYKYDPGMVAMANSGSNSNGSQFFVVTGGKAAFLNQQPNYTIFGKVANGMETVAKINETPTDLDPNSLDGQNGTPSKPKEQITIDSITITEKK